MTDATWPLVGREDDRARILAALRSGSRLVVVTGAAGTGKSRLLDDSATSAAAAGLTVLRIAANPVLQHIPLGALGPLLGDRQPAPADPGALFALARERAAELSPGRPALVVVDDVGSLDTVSMTVLAQLAAAGAVVLLVASTGRSPLPDPLVAVWEAGRATRVDLVPLTGDQVGVLLEAALGGRVAQGTVAHLHAAAGENLLHLREIVAGGRADGTLVKVSGGWRLVGEPTAPPSLRDLILARVRSLGPVERDVVERLAVCGEIPVAAIPGVEVRSALTGLEAAGTVTIETGPEGLVARLTQPVYRSAVADGLTRLRRCDLLAEQAELLEALATGTADLGRALTWRIEAGLPVDGRLLRSACHAAREAGDGATVLELTDAGLRSGRDVELLLLRGEALLRAGRVADALETLEIAQRSVPPHLLPAFAAVTGLAHAHRIGGRPQGLRAVEDAVQQVGGADQLLALTRALILLHSERVTEARQQVDELSASIADDDRAAALVAAAQAIPLAAMGRSDEAVEAARLAVDFARRSPERVPGLAVVETLQILGEVLMLSLRLTEARTVATQALVGAIDEGDELVARTSELLLGRITFFAGDLDAAQRWLDDARSGAAALGPESIVVPAVAMLSMTATARGDLQQARALFADIQDVPDESSGVDSSRWYLAGCSGAPKEAVAAMVELAARLRDQGHRSFAGGVLLLAVDLDRPEEIASTARTLADGSSGGFLGTLADHAEAAAAGDAAALLAVADAWEATGAPRYAAAASATAARALRAAGQARAAAAARARAEELVARCGGLTVPVLRFDDELTPLTRREREIAAMAAAGSSSREIAARLYLSTRTVDNHLQSVYGKLGISGRHELVAR